MFSQELTPIITPQFCHLTPLFCKNTFFSPDVQVIENHNANNSEVEKTNIIHIIQNLSKVKTKGWPQSALSKRTASQVFDSTCLKPSRFEHAPKEEKQAIEVDNNIIDTRKKSWGRFQRRP